MKLRIIIALLLSAILSSCSSMTKAFVSDIAWDDSLSVEEKLLAFGGDKVSVPLPEMFFEGSQWLSAITDEIEGAEDYILISTFLGSSSELLEPGFQHGENPVERYFIVDQVFHKS